MSYFPHPGEILKLEFLDELGISAYALAKAIQVPKSRIYDIINEERGIAPDTAIRLSRYFGNSAQFWLNLQAEYDLRQLQGKGTYKHIKPLAA